MKSAPIALFVYNRPSHTKRVLEALQANTLASVSDLFIFSDGPKTNANDQVKRQIAEVRKLINETSGFKSVTVIESPVNKGITSAIFSGINHVLENHDRIIVFEDDICAHPSFLSYSNEALERYKNNEEVFAISGFSFPVKGKLPPTFFIRFGATWGWACWKRSWNHFTLDAGKLIEEIERTGRIQEFDFNNNYPFYEELKRGHAGKVEGNAWDTFWYATIFIHNGLSYYPAKSLTLNIGMDGSGTHYNRSQTASAIHSAFSVTEEECLEIINHKPEVIAPNQQAQKAFTNYFFTYQKGGVINQVKHVLRKYGKIKI